MRAVADKKLGTWAFPEWWWWGPSGRMRVLRHTEPYMQLCREQDTSNTRTEAGKSRAGAYTDAKTCRAHRAGVRSGPGAQAYDDQTRNLKKLAKETPGVASVWESGARQASAPVKQSWMQHDARDLRASF